MILSRPARQELTALDWRETWRVAIVLALIVIAANLQALVGDGLGAAADGPRQKYPAQLHTWSMLARGELPTWSNTLMSGYPIFAGPQVAMAYPANWIFGLFRTPVAYNAVAILHLWLAGMGTYLLARGVTVRWPGALIAALAMVFGASMAARIAAGHNGEIFNRALMPWMLAGITFLAYRPSWRRMIFLGGVFGLMLLVGPNGYQMVMYTGLIACVWGIFLLLTQIRGADRWRFVLWCAMAMAAGVGISAIQTLPTADLLAQGNRQGGLAEHAIDVAALPVPMALGYVLPHTFDDPTITDYVWPEFATYMGAAMLFLALYAIRNCHRQPLVRLWGAVIVVALMLSFGLQNPIYRLILDVFPPYNLVRNPARHLAIVQLGLALLAGIGTDSLLAVPRPALTSREIRGRLAVIAFALVVVIVAGMVRVEAEHSFDVFPQRLIRGAAWFSAALLAFWLSLHVALATRTRAAHVLLFGVVLLELYLYAHPMFYGGEVPERLAFINADRFSSDYLVALHEDESDYAARIMLAADEGVPVLNIYSAILPQRTVRVMNLTTGRSPDYYLEHHMEFVELARPDLLDLLGVRWLLLEPEQSAFDDPTLRRGPDEDVMRVFENEDALPLARLVPAWDAVAGPDESIAWLEQPGTDYATRAVIEGDVPAEQACPERANAADTDSVTNLRLEGGDIYLTAQTAAPRLLVINQTYIRGWQAWVGDDAATVYPANHRALGVYLPCAGTHEVHLRHLPRSLQLGAALSLVTVAGIALALGGAWVRHRISRK